MSMNWDQAWSDGVKSRWTRTFLDMSGSIQIGKFRKGESFYMKRENEGTENLTTVHEQPLKLNWDQTNSDL